MKKNLGGLLAALLLTTTLATAPAAHATVTITPGATPAAQLAYMMDFEDLAPNTPADTPYSNPDGSITMVYTAGTLFTGHLHVSTPIGLNDAASGGRAGYFQLDFSSPTSLMSASLGSLFSGGNAHLEFLDASDTVVGTADISGLATGGLTGYTFASTVPFVRTLYQVTGSPAFGLGGIEGSAVDNVGYGLLAGVPEPSTWAMMMAGFGLIGLAARQRRRQQHASAA
jgi:hypothetical protein